MSIQAGGNDPANCSALAPTPGVNNTGQPAITDSHGDGMPNSYEDANGLDKFSDADALLDSDGDGQANRAEYVAGTSPHDSADRLAITSVTRAVPGPGYVLTFTARARRAYTIQYKNALTDPAWQDLSGIAPPARSRSCSRPIPPRNLRASIASSHRSHEADAR